MGVAELLGDPAGFYRMQRDRCAALGIEVVGLPVGHLAYRTRTWREYLGLRGELEEHCSGNFENVWNGRPISKILVRSPISLDDGASVELIELIPPFHQRVYKMGLEHLGFVGGKDFDEFSIRHRPVLNRPAVQSAVSEPLYILFEDYSHVKFHRYSLSDVCRMEGTSFDGILVQGGHPRRLRDLVAAPQRGRSARERDF
jgi:predicted metalloenzyme YecM